MYVKLHASILDSTIWAESHATRITWLTMLAMADRDGLILARAPGIAARARVTREECETALRCFRSPDPDSRTPDHDGRRIIDTAEGILILNYEVHRDRASTEEAAEKHAARQARYRERVAARAKKRDAKNVTSDARVTVSDTVSRDVIEVTHSEAEQKQSRSEEREGPPPAWTWASVMNLWNDATGVLHGATPKNREALQRIVATHDEAAIRAAIAEAKTDGWARDKGVGPTHLEQQFGAYLAKAKKRSGTVEPDLTPEAAADRARGEELRALYETETDTRVREQYDAELDAIADRARARARKAKRQAGES